MMLKRIISFLCVVILVLTFSMTVSAAVPNLAQWNECPMYSVLNDGGDSNSAVDCIVIRINPELESNQFHMLFMADLTSFEDEANAGIKIKFNNIGTVELYCDGRTEYNPNTFFAEIDNVFSDEASMMLGIEFTVGIKPGIPDNTIISFNFYDTQGVASNTYSVDITDSYVEEEPETEEEAGLIEKTQKTRTTKYKTTKIKTTKVKTTKVRTTKSKADKGSYSDTEDEEEYEIQVNEQTLQQEAFEDVHVENDKTKLIIICAAAVIACTIGGCTAGIINSRKKKHGRGDEQQ